MDLLNLKPLKIGVVILPIWFLLFTVIGFIILPQESWRAFTSCVACVFISCQSVIAKDDKYSVAARNFLRILGIGFSIKLFLDFF